MEVRINHKDHNEMPYYYQDIPATLYRRFTTADSYGKFYHNNIRQGNFDREYTNTLPETNENIADILYNVPSSLAGFVKNDYKDFYQRHTDLIDMLSKRRHDKSLLYVQDNQKFIGYTVEMLYLTVCKVEDLLNSEENAELNNTQIQNFEQYMNAMKSYITAHNM